MTQQEYESKMRAAKLRAEQARADKLEAEARAAKDGKNSSSIGDQIKDVAMTGVMVNLVSGMFKS